jgi:hypothetical protein
MSDQPRITGTIRIGHVAAVQQTDRADSATNPFNSLSKPTKPETDLEARALKVTAVSDPAAVTRIHMPNGMPRIELRITISGRVYKAELNAKSLWRCIAAINAASSDDAIAVVLQGKLDGATILEAGIVAQPKTPKPEAAA